MTVAVNKAPGIASRLVNGILAIKPLANFAKHQARQMMIKRAQRIGVPWINEVKTLQARDWTEDFAQVQNPQITYPDYYLTSFHGYDEGDLSWQAAFELEVAARTVHAGIWQDGKADGDAKLRQSYHDILKVRVPQPRDILDLGCSVGLSTFTLQETYPHAQVTGLDLSPYFLAVAKYRAQQSQAQINWIHATAESTGLPDRAFDLVSLFLICHELPQLATQKIFAEVRRILRPGGHISIMDMNPQSEAYKKMPPYILTLLKSTEPYMDQYFALDIEQTLIEAGFQTPTITKNSPRHRTVIAQVRD
ncbi:class I SAM-dependent methyltransferase [Anabaena sp. CCY 9910]|uniref:class I SAM-dependent methyltransferase n=1 Tax=Anabaena sp. CCY 9910 TaxID=3103870 RepID=UPI0039E15F71